MAVGEEEISELPEDSKKIFKQNIVDRYMDSPNTTSFDCKFAALDAFWFAGFSCYIHLEMRKSFSSAILPHMLVNFENLA